MVAIVAPGIHSFRYFHHFLEGTKGHIAAVPKNLTVGWAMKNTVAAIDSAVMGKSQTVGIP